MHMIRKNLMLFTTTEPLENAGPQEYNLYAFFHDTNSTSTLARVPITVHDMFIDIVVRLRHHDIARIPHIELRAR